MKKTIALAATTAATLAALASATAHAQSNVTMYGILNLAVERYSNADAAGNSVTRMPSLGGGMFPSFAVRSGFARLLHPERSHRLLADQRL